jgi:hypothetical protein
MPRTSRTNWVTEFALAAALVAAACAPAGAKTLLEMTTGVRYIIEEATAWHFTSAEVTFFVNRAQNAVVDLTDDRALLELTRIGTQSVTLNQYSQSLPSGCARVVGVFLNDYKATQKPIGDIWSISPNRVGRGGESVSSTNPFYVLFNNAILVYPLQTSAGTLEVHYVKYPTALSADATECDLSERVEDLVVLQASVYLLLKDHETAKAAAIQERLMQEVALVNAKFGASSTPPTPGASK